MLLLVVGGKPCQLRRCRALRDEDPPSGCSILICSMSGLTQKVPGALLKFLQSISVSSLTAAHIHRS